jgi:hypothetical protein
MQQIQSTSQPKMSTPTKRDQRSAFERHNDGQKQVQNKEMQRKKQAATLQKEHFPLAAMLVSSSLNPNKFCDYTAKPQGF